MIRPPYYSDEKNAQILLALLKAHGIRKIIASPGSTNIAFVGSAQHDPFFEMYSAVDERHAAYMACGLATESGETVVLSCTGATASRNYFPAITEAYYRKLPILAVTSMQKFSRSGNLFPQWLERGMFPEDTFVMSVSCPMTNSAEDERSCALKVNRAILELRHNGGGPVHINLETSNNGAFTTKELPAVQKICRISYWDGNWPEVPSGKIAIWITSHKPMSEKCVGALERFADKYNAVIFTDCTSSYKSRHSVCVSLLAAQNIRAKPAYEHLLPNLIIHLGGVSGDYQTRDMLYSLAPVWRVSEDGVISDSLGGLTHVFEMPEHEFFLHYADTGLTSPKETYVDEWNDAVNCIRKKIPELPFSNLWVAGEFDKFIPSGSVLHCAILSSLRNMNFLSDFRNAETMSNVGGFGIDGCVSTLIGASLANPGRLHFILTGDMAFFYDLNALGNRHVGRNVRILLVRNGISGEMSMPISAGAKLGEAALEFVCSQGHFGDKSPELVKSFARGLGFEYLCASDKAEFAVAIPKFVAANSEHPKILECFTQPEDERVALDMILHIDQHETNRSVLGALKELVPDRLKRVIKAAIQ